MSSKFELEKFAIQPTTEQLDVCRKDDLFSIAYQITVSCGAFKRNIKEAVYKHLVEHGVLSEVGEAGVAVQASPSVGKGEEVPKPVELASIDPTDPPSPHNPLLAVRLKELELELSKQQYQSQLVHLRTVELEAN
ncbi:hypothetical protein QQF64_012088 [Cirrhinus molitorella]|uniref:Uncharacterized protein n=1 Tax=Cirrhinus molitorella TaxID=172907 RepID=A0ABR3LUN5_9TELE